LAGGAITPQVPVLVRTAAEKRIHLPPGGIGGWGPAYSGKSSVSV
jgi:hypothetical protein